MLKLWNIIKNITKGFCFGFKDSLLGFFLVFSYDVAPMESSASKYISESELTSLAKDKAAQKLKKHAQISLNKNRTVKDKVYRMCKANGCAYGTSLAIFNLILMPAMSYLTSLFDDGTQSSFSVYLRQTCEYLFNALWLIPIFLTFKLINVFWCQDLAYNAYWQKQGKPQPMTSIGQVIADLLFTIFVEILFMFQGSIANLPISIDLPHYVKLTFGFLHMSLLNSLYSFEYSWSYMGWSLDRRLSFVEKNWSYFLGFGCIPALVAMLLSSIIWSGCLLSVMFPLFIISANEAVPYCGDNGCALKLFMPAVYVASSCTDFFFKTKKTTSQTTNNKSFR